MKPDSGSLFKNDKKTSDKSPDYKGSCLIDGTEMWIAAWLKDGKSGKYMSLSFTPKDEPVKKAPPRLASTDEDLLPW